MTDSSLTIINLFPELLGTYGDRGNALILKKRTELYGYKCDLIDVSPSEAVPFSGDIYLLGGAEDLAQVTAVNLLLRSNSFKRVTEEKKVVFGVCAGFQILGESFFTSENKSMPGLGLLKATTIKGKKRAVGEVMSIAYLNNKKVILTGYENHSGRTHLTGSTIALGKVIKGVGNGFKNQEGAVYENVIGTYMHGPVFARNPKLADFLITKATGDDLNDDFDVDRYAFMLRKQLIKKSVFGKIISTINKNLLA